MCNFQLVLGSNLFPAIYSVVKAKYVYIFIRSLALTASDLNTPKSTILAVIGVGLSASGLIILGYLTSVQMAGKATEVVLDRTTVGAMQSVSFSNPHITEGQELFLLARVASNPTAQPDDTLRVQLIGPDGRVLLEREFDSSFAAAPVSNTDGNHHVVITNLEDKDLEVYASLRVRDAGWVNTDWPSAMTLAGIAIIIASAIIRFRSSSKTSKIL
jgi:hypothetical protein